jgi:hypothetical protein
MQVKCTSCGASQNINQAQNCDFCGNLIELESAKNNYQSSLSGETGNLMAMAETAIEATNWDEALQYFNRVLEKDITNSDAWLGKGIAIVYTSKIGDLKITEAIAYWKNAIKHADNQEAMGKRVAKEINDVVNQFYPTLENHFIQFKDLENSYQDLVSKFATLEKAQDYAVNLEPTNVTYSRTGYSLCSRVIQIPKKYALEDMNSAMVDAAFAGLQQNKYKRNDANDKYQKGKNRKIEIEKASQLVYDIEMKYINNIIAIEPNDYEINNVLKKYELLEKQKQQDHIDNIRIEAKVLNFVYFIGYSILSIFILWLLYGIILKNSGVNKANGFITMILMFLGFYVGYLIRNKRHPNLKK